MLVGEDAAALEEAHMRLARVGIEKIAGALAGGILAWVEAGKPIGSVDQVSVRDAAQMLEKEPDAVTLLDVREQNERTARGAVAGSVWIPLPALRERIGELGRGKTLMVMCQGGYRSSIATSLLSAAGIQQVADVVGGFDAWSIAFPEVANAGAACANR